VKAARYYGQGDIRVDDIPQPTPGPGQVQVAVDWCGICGSDLHEFLEGPIFIPPKGAPHPITGAELPAVVMGHEFAGVVSDVGAGVTGISEGDRVAVEPYYVCGECSACAAGRARASARRSVDWVTIHSSCHASGRVRTKAVIRSW